MWACYVYLKKKKGQTENSLGFIWCNNLVKVVNAEQLLHFFLTVIGFTYY